MTEIANTAMAAAWDGDEGAHWAENQERYEGSTVEHHDLLLAMASVTEGERVLDIGCGNGKTTREAARAAGPSGSALGVDLSSRMLENARRLAAAEGVTNVEFLQVDAQVHPFDEGAFDLAMSRFGVMFFSDPVAAFTKVRRALKPSGRLALMVWGPMAKNEWLTTIRGALAAGRDLPVPPPLAPSPVGWAEPEAVRPILADAGFTELDFEEATPTLRYAKGTAEAFEFMKGQGGVRALLADLDEEAQAQALDRLHAELAARETSRGVELASTVIVITGRRASRK